MRIRLDLLRDIMKLVIDDESGNLSSPQIVSDEDSPETIAFHVKTLIDEGCLTALDGSSKDGRAYYNLEPTFKGQQFYDSIEDSSIWNKTKKYISEHAIEFTVEAVIKAASHFVYSAP